MRAIARASGSVSEIWSARAIQFGQHLLVTIALALDGGDLLGQFAVAIARTATRSPVFVGIALIKPFHVAGEPLVRVLDGFGERCPGEVSGLVVDRLDARAVHRQELAPEQVELTTQHHELAEYRFEGGTVVTTEVGDGLEVRLEVPQQPDDLDIAVCLGFKAPARPDPVQVAIDVELEQISRIVARATRCLWLYADEPGRAKVEPVDESLDEPDRVVRPDIIIHRLGQQQKLRAVRSRQMRHASNIPCAAIRGNPQAGFSHSLFDFCIRNGRVWW
jgi:hypothetical protein